MSEHYFVHNGFRANVPCKWVAETPYYYDKGRNFLLFRVNPNPLGGGKIATLDNIDADGHGRGSVLLASMAYDAMLLEATTLFALFQPRGVRESIRTWYEHRGIDVNSDNELYGQLSVIYAKTMSSLAKHKTTFETAAKI